MRVNLDKMASKRHFLKDKQIPITQPSPLSTPSDLREFRAENGFTARMTNEARHAVSIVNKSARMVQSTMQKGLDTPLKKKSEGLVDRVMLTGHLPKQYAGSREQQDGALRKLQNDLYRQGMDTLQIGDLIHLINSARKQKKSTNTLEAGVRPIEADSLAGSEQSEALLRALLYEYILRVKRQVRKWLSITSFEQDSAVFPNKEGHLVTNDPEDIVYVINAELDVAEEYLPSEFLIDLMVALFEEMELMQSRIKNTIDHKISEVDLERVCSVVNDSIHMGDKSLEFLDGGVRGAMPTYELKKKAEECEKGYLDLALHATFALVKIVFEDIKPLLAKVCTAAWEAGELIPTCLATLQDYFADFEEWIYTLFYGKFVRKCFEEMIRYYLISLFDKNKEFQSFDLMCEMLDRDRMYLLEFFGDDMLPQMRQSGVGGYDAVKERVEILRSLGNILKEDHPKNVVEDIDNVIHELGNETGTIAIMYLAQIKAHNDKAAVCLWKSAVITSCQKHPVGSLQVRTVLDLSHLVKSHQIMDRINRFSDDKHFVHSLILVQKHPMVEKLNNQRSHAMHRLKSTMGKAKIHASASVRKVRTRIKLPKPMSNQPGLNTIRSLYLSEREYLKKARMTTTRFE